MYLLGINETMATAKLKKHLDLLKVLARSKPRLTRTILPNLSKEEIECICECCYNVLHGNVPLSSTQKRKLFKFKKVLHGLVDRKKKIRAKRRILAQSGGGFPFALLAPILAIATALISDGRI